MSMDKITEWVCKRKKQICFITFLLTIVLSVWGYRCGIFTDTAKMQTLLDRAGFLAPLLFIAIQAIQVVIPILPGAVGCVFGVAFFGAVKGFIYNYIGICIGSVIAFLIARSCGQDFVINMTGKKFFSKYSRYLIDENRFEKAFAILIFLPIAPDDFLCYLAGISGIKTRKFVAIILLGKPAAILLYSLGLYQLLQIGLNYGN